MIVKYCNVNCQMNHWPKHKKECKQRAAELHDEALFKDPPAKEDCPICFLPMPAKLISCIMLPPATISSVPIHDFAEANEELAGKATEVYYPCCGKSICRGCEYSFVESGNEETCPFCKSDRMSKTDAENVEDLMKRVEANDAFSIYVLGSYYYHGDLGLQQDWARAMELWKQAADLGSSKAHCQLGISCSEYEKEGDSKKAEFHYEAAAMAGDEVVRLNLGCMEAQSGNMGRAVKHWTIAASAGNYTAMHYLLIAFNQSVASRATIDSSLRAYNNSCAEMRSDAREAFMGMFMVNN